MPTVIEEQTLIKGGKTDVGVFKITRNADGLVVNVKSEKLVLFFKQIGHNKKQPDSLGNDIYYLDGTLAEQLRMSTEDFDISFDDVGSQPFTGSRISLSFLRNAKLGEGVELKFPGVYSKALMIKIQKSIKFAMQKLYINYMKPVEISCEIHTHEYQKVDATNG